MRATAPPQPLAVVVQSFNPTKLCGLNPRLGRLWREHSAAVKADTRRATARELTDGLAAEPLCDRAEKHLAMFSQALAVALVAAAALRLPVEVAQAKAALPTYGTHEAWSQARARRRSVRARWAP
jgi:hypothetical protein